MWNRLRVIQFRARFIRPDSPNPAPAAWADQKRERRFPMDVDFGSRVSSIAPAFAWYLLERRKNPVMLLPPAAVLEASAAYRATNDLTSIFINDCTTIGDAESRVTASNLFERYKKWYKQNYTGAMTTKRDDLINELTKIWDYPTVLANGGSFWTGRDLTAEALLT